MQPPRRSLREWPTLGRDAELAQLATMLANAREGFGEHQVRGVTLNGPAGIGKTALAVAAVRAAVELGFETERLVATASSREVRLLWLSPLLNSSSQARDRFDLLIELEELITRRSPDRPMVILLDDVPLLDDADLELIAQLVRRGRIFLIATARDTHGGVGPLNPLFTDGTLERIAVGPLAPRYIEQAAVVALGGPLDRAAAAALCGASDGVPLFARELVAANLAQRTLVERDGTWTLDRQALIPPTLVGLITDRYRGLQPGQQRYLETLAVAQPLPARIRPDGLELESLAELEDLGLITASLEGETETIRLAHPLFAEAILAHCGPLRRREVAQRAHSALQMLPGRDPDRDLRMATLCLEHHLPVDADIAISGATRALNRLDPELAERLLDAVDPPTWTSRFLRGTARGARGQVDEAVSALADAFASATTDAERARAASRWANSLTIAGGRYDDALVVIDKALGEIEDPQWRAFLAADRAYTLLALGRPAEAAFIADVSTDADTTGTGTGTGTSESGADSSSSRVSEDRATVRANECLIGAAIASLAGRGAQTEALVAEGLTLVQHLVVDIPTARELLNLSRFIWLASAGRSSEAHAIVESELARCTGRGAVSGIWMTARAMQRMLNGDPHGAASDARRATEDLIDLDTANLRPFACATLAAGMAQLQRPAEATTALDAVEEIWRDETKTRLMSEQAAGWMLAFTGQRRAGATRISRAAQVALDAQHAPLAMMVAHDAARIGHPSVALPVLRTAAQHCEGRLVHALLEHASALDSGHADELMALAQELPGLGVTVSAAEAAVAAAAIFDTSRRSSEAVRARALAAELIEPFGDIATPGLSNVTTLTARERQIAELAARRRRSREIADELGISVRTVDNHLVSVYRKLGVSNRSELEHYLESRRR